MKCVCTVLHCHLWPVRLYHIFPHYLINGTTHFWQKKKFLSIKCVLILSKILSEIFFIPRRIERDIMHVEKASGIPYMK